LEVSLDDHAADFLPAEQRYKSERDETKRSLDRSLKAYEELLRKCDLLVSIDSTVSEAPRWARKAPKKGEHVGIANLLLSDLHLDEVVFPAQVGNVNAYNRKIALDRLRLTAEKACEIGKDYIRGIKYEGATVWLGGDIFSGTIHEELRNTNEAPIMASCDFWVDPIVALLRLMADEFGKVHVPGCVGNHGRNTHKPIMKNRVEDNFDWLFYRVIARELRGDDRFTWQLPVTTDVSVQHYGHRYLLTHGDQFRGGSGISGIQTPLALGAFRKSKRQQAVDDPFDTMILGHFHQYMTLPGIIVNGSLKGLDEYALISNFGYEVPQQAFWISTPERGPAFHVAVQPMNRKAEGW
jgi:hypothetical protein